MHAYAAPAPAPAPVPGPAPPQAPFHPALSRQEVKSSQAKDVPYSDTEPWKVGTAHGVSPSACSAPSVSLSNSRKVYQSSWF